MGFFPGTVLPFLGRVAEQQGGQGNGGCSGLLRWEGECGGGSGGGGGRFVASSCFPMDHFINIPGQKFEGPLQTN